MVEEGLKCTEIKNVFLTSNSYRNISGLKSLGLNAQNDNLTEKVIHGYSEGLDLIQTSMKDAELDKYCFHSDIHFQNEELSSQSFSCQVPDNADVSVKFYLFSTMQIRPKLDKEKLEKLNLPPLFEKSGRMKEFFLNETVVLEDGREITSKSILKDLKDPEKFIVLECPDARYIEPIAEAMPYDRFSDEHGALAVVFHLTDNSVFELPLYQKMIAKMDSHSAANEKKLLHVVVDSGADNVAPSYSTFYLQTCLRHHLDVGVFPRLRYYDDVIERRQQDQQQHQLKEPESTEHGIRQGLPFAEVTINPLRSQHRLLDTELGLRLQRLNDETVLEELRANTLFHADIDHLRDISLQARETATSPSFPLVTFLGTSSAVPSKYRNTSAILVQVRENDYVLFDCGEGTLARILMLFGEEKGNDVIRKLRLIGITHKHLDHHFGLTMLLLHRANLDGVVDRCLVLAADNVRHIHRILAQAFHHPQLYGDGSHLQSPTCDWLPIQRLDMPDNDFGQGHPRTVLDHYQQQYHVKLSIARVFHTGTSFGFSLDADGWRLVYSGDCAAPQMRNLAAIGRDCDLLIHEATFDNGQEEMAAFKKHSTVGQALAVAEQMGAKAVVLTHFSSRHALIPPVNPRDSELQPCSAMAVAHAFDFLQISPATAGLLKIMDPYLQYLFPKHWRELHSSREKTIQRRTKTRDTVIQIIANSCSSKKRKIDSS